MFTICLLVLAHLNGCRRTPLWLKRSLFVVEIYPFAVDFPFFPELWTALKLTILVSKYTIKRHQTHRCHSILGHKKKTSQQEKREHLHSIGHKTNKHHKKRRETIRKHLKHLKNDLPNIAIGTSFELRDQVLWHLNTQYKEREREEMGLHMKVDLLFHNLRFKQNQNESNMKYGSDNIRHGR